MQVRAGEDARKIWETTPRERILDSRFVKTRRTSPDEENQTEIKCRWALKGFQDPDLLELERQSPTLSSDALAVALQILASYKWLMHFMDVEGAFLQGEGLRRKHGEICAHLGGDVAPGIPEGAVF